ncbi:unnamed protein product [Caenorhabditis auriculariae]|uniref:CUB domain-containing protein n=1 Tax=Caenorhabditis auriculariae TaxID=2777116 RepID=A0A8S1HNM9_9PELO|nr:unnamed protein product [Caenorhabditis auriculariae]
MGACRSATGCVPVYGPQSHKFDPRLDPTKGSFGINMWSCEVILLRRIDELHLSCSKRTSEMDSPLRCSLEIITCPNCNLNLKFRPPAEDLPEEELEMMPSCTESKEEPCFDLQFVESKADSTLPATYRRVSIWDFPYRNEFNSTGNSLTINLVMWNLETNSTLYNYIQNFFPLLATAVTNDEIIIGSPLEIPASNYSSIGFFESPRYPEAYPTNLIKRYFLINSSPNGFIRLIFDDFHVHYQSELQIFDSDGSEILNSRRENRRPSALVTKGSTLTVEFRAHNYTNLVGFRARYEFVMDIPWPEKPNYRDCDDYLENYGGEIRLDRLSHLANSYVDCIWIVGRLPHVSRVFDRVYLKAEQFHLKGVSLRLEIREGCCSTSDRLLLLSDQQSRDQLSHQQPRFGYTTSLTNPAFYIRLRGFLMNTSGLEIVYSQFYRWTTPVCPGMGEFRCDNARCIKSSLRCDGSNHCGDDSDEICHVPVDDFQEQRETSDVSGIVALTIGVCGALVLLMSTVAVVSRLYRRRIAMHSSRRVSRVSTIGPTRNEFSPSIQTIGERRFYVVPESQVSVIEAPPSYDDALKHPSVPTSSAYANRAFQSAEQEQSSGELPPEREPPREDEPTCSGLTTPTPAAVPADSDPENEETRQESWV